MVRKLKVINSKKIVIEKPPQEEIELTTREEYFKSLIY